MRNGFDEQLKSLNTELITMGALCESAISSSVKALLEGRLELAKNACEYEKQIDHKEREIQSLCMQILLQQQPVARDLRVVSSALKMITDMERIGDQAADIAEILEYANLSLSRNRKHIEEMADATIHMVTESVDAFVKKDIQLAHDVIVRDDTVDELFMKVKSDIVALIAEDSAKGEQAVDILMIAKYLERIGDHATNIAEWVTYSMTGSRNGGDEE